jgi:predicted DNA-binding transcriptional regulator AlpA
MAQLFKPSKLQKKRYTTGGCSTMMIWRLRRDGKLPKPKKLGNRNVTPENEVDNAIAVLIGD